MKYIFCLLIQWLLIKSTLTQEIIEFWDVEYIELPIGEFDGFLTPEQYYNYLSDVEKANPEITTFGQVGLSYEKRSIYAICLGRCGDDDDMYVPQTFLNAMHHAREPEGLMSILFFIDDFLKILSDKTNPKYYEYMHTMHTRQIWMVPLLNIDGYVYNIAHPSEKNQRKNRRPTCDDDSKSGVDLNRNYDVCFEDSIEGSSTNTCAEDYRGTEPFSEPESHTMFEFSHMHNFSTSINFHSFGNDIILPFSCQSKDSEEGESARQNYLFKFGSNLAKNTNYKVGKSFSKTIGLYSVNGDFADWLYSELEVYSVSVEVGEKSFYPAFDEIEEIGKNTLKMMKYSTQVSGPFLTVKELHLYEHLPSSSKCVSLSVVNEGTWHSFGHNFFIEGKVRDNEKVTETQMNKMDKLNAFFGTISTELCFSLGSFNDFHKLEIIISDAAHCIFYSFESKEQKLIQTEELRTDPGYGKCTSVEKIKTPYFERPKLSEMSKKEVIHKKKHVPKIWDKDYPKQKKESEQKSSSNILSLIFSSLKGSIFVVGVIGLCAFFVSFCVVSLILRYQEQKDKLRRGKYSEVVPLEEFDVENIDLNSNSEEENDNFDEFEVDSE